MSASPPTLQAPASDARVEQLVSSFSKKYGEAPAFISRAPGRVNLIGEHIDYMGYGVLPMAIEQDIMIAGRLNTQSLLKLSNVNSKYADFECPSSFDTSAIDSSSPQWYHYFLCGYLGIAEHLQLGKDLRLGMDLMVCGNIPPSAGLSSSSALVCASALITYKLISKKELAKSELAQICCDCERYIGTQGGGMDQSISFLADQGKAKMIDFNPIRASDVILPEGFVFVISHCLAELNKAATSDFNQRVVECRLASQCIAKDKGLSWRDMKRLGDLQSALNYTLEEMLQLVKDKLHQAPYNKDEVLQLLEISSEELMKTSLSSNTAHLTLFKLYERAYHVFSEALRVKEFKEECDKTRTDAIKLGELLDASHTSLRDIYSCSHPDLDELTDICRQSGALGSRLTGAGWGGCAVSLVPEEKAADFIKTVSDAFYTAERLRGKDINQVLFKTAPASGACLYKCT